MRVGRPSELDVVGEAPRAAGGRRALRAGRRQLHESLDVENKKLSKGRCWCTGLRIGESCRGDGAQLDFSRRA